MRAYVAIYLAFLMLTLFGCGTSKEVFRIAELPDRTDGDWPVWPKGDQVPRFVYVGDLTGESNFGVDGPTQCSLDIFHS